VLQILEIVCLKNSEDATYSNNCQIRAQETHENTKGFFEAPSKASLKNEAKRAIDDSCTSRVLKADLLHQSHVPVGAAKTPIKFRRRLHVI